MRRLRALAVLLVVCGVPRENMNFFQGTSPLFVLKRFFVCFAVALFILAGNTQAQTVDCNTHTPSDPPTDQDALIALYCATDGDNWTDNTNWLTNEDIHDWHGVSALPGRVTSLQLPDNQLSGEIPDLSALTNLRFLSLWGNELTGEIPDLSAFSNLTGLHLNSNQLSGEIPDLSALTNLLDLNLWGNELTGEIPDLSALTSLGALDLSSNQLSGEIPDLSALINLRSLFLRLNELTGEIPDLSALTSLLDLNLSSNMLSGEIPATLGNVISLEYLYLNNNQLSGKIPDLSALTNLAGLELWGNELTGEIPDLSALTNLRRLELWRNELTGEIPDLSALTNLTGLALSRNKLTGSIPTWLGDLTSLQWLYLNDNMLDGSIPATLRNLTSLSYLYLWGNELTGEIPDLSTLTLLEELDLSRNKLTGSIPTWLGDLTSLELLYLNNNMFTGSIPATLGNLTSLELLYLNNNMFTGSIPDLSRLISLEQLSLSNNQLDGSIPATLGNLTSLELLYLNNNMFTGSIPDLSRLTSLRELSLSNNQLDGSIPATLGNLTSLKLLYLWGNEQLTWDNLSNELGVKVDRAVLQALYNHNNGENWSNTDGKWFPEDETDPLSFSGWHGVSVDDTTGRVSGLDLSNNNLRKEIASALEALDYLKTLNLANNRQLTGELPLRLMDLPLETLDIRCTSVSTPADTDFQTWLSGITNFRRVCPPPPRPAPPPPPPPPPPPEQVTGVMVIEGVEQLSVLWDSVSGADGYKVQWKSGLQQFDDPDDPSREHITSDNTASYTISNLAPGTEYTVRVIATKSGGAADGTPSPEMTGIPGAPPPPQVTGVMVTQGVEQLSVLWDSVSGADGYKVQWKSGLQQFDDPDDPSREHITSDNTASYTISNLAPGTEYTVRVIATKAYADDGTPSPEMTGIPGAPPPPQVTEVMVTQGVEQLSVLWDSVSGADGYKVQWKSGSDKFDSSRQHVVTGGDTTKYTISNLAPGTEYTVRVIATKADADDGTPSPEMTGIPSGRGGCTIASNGMKGNTSNSVLLNLLLMGSALFLVVSRKRR